MLVVVDERGYPLYDVALWDGYRRYPVDGSITLTVTGPVTLSASKPGYATSAPRLFLPGDHEIRLYRVARAN